MALQTILPVKESNRVFELILEYVQVGKSFLFGFSC